MIMTDREKLIHNEKMKLLANFFNNAGVGIVVGGGLIFGWQLIVSSFEKHQSINQFGLWGIQAMAIFLSICAHFAARKFLENLVD
jgi:hypothetical protein